MAEERAEAQKQEAIALNPLRQGLTIDAIAQATGLTIVQLQQLQAKNPVVIAPFVQQSLEAVSCQTRRTSATVQAWAIQPRGAIGESPSKISLKLPKPWVYSWSAMGWRN
jgi:hypothetical protein